MATQNTQSGAIGNYVAAADATAQDSQLAGANPRRDKLALMNRIIVTLGAVTLADIAVLLGAAYGERYTIAVIALVVYCAVTVAWGLCAGYYVCLTAKNVLAHFRYGKKPGDSVPNA